MRERARLAGIMAGITVVYVVAGVAGLKLAAVNPATTAIWPPAGIAVAALLVLGLRAWPVAAVGAFITNLIVLKHPGAAATIAVGNTLEYVVAAALTVRFARGREAFERGSDIFRFTFLAAIAAPVIAASVGTIALRFWSLAPAGDTWRIWIAWWLGDATSVVLFAPVCVLMTVRLPAPRAGRVELAALGVALMLVMYAVFGVPAEAQRNVPLAALMLPLMLWSAFRVDARLTAALGVGLSVVAVYRTLRDFGPFQLGVPTDSLLAVQSLVSIVVILLLAVAVEIGVRRRVESELRSVNESLERRVAERTAEVTRLHDRMAEAQSLAQIGSWEWNVETNTLWWSEELCRIFGVSMAPSGYERYLALLHPDDRDWTDVEVRTAMKEGRDFTFDHRIVRPDGETRVIHAKGRVEFDGTGAPRRLLGSGHDITERLRAEHARAQLIEEQAKLREAEEASRAKDAFLATLSHELRTPLNAALGWTHILRDTQKPGDRDHRIVQAIYRNLQLQSKIVSDILDISMITRGELPLDQQPVELRGVFESAMDMLRQTASAKRVSVRMHGDAAPVVVGDSRRLQQVAWNLLSNAIKFSREGGNVTVSMVGIGDAVECSVEDDGPGIDAQFLPRVFEQFSQADSSTTREHGGLGLGLAIAREIVAMHGGSITAANRTGGGAVFVVRLMAGAAGERGAAAVPVRT